MRLRNSESVDSGHTKKTSINTADLLKSVTDTDVRKLKSDAPPPQRDNLLVEKTSELFLESSSSNKSEDKEELNKKNVNVERSQRSSDPDRPFDDPRSRQDRRLNSQPYLMPEGGCRRKRNRRSRRSMMRGGFWWMQRTYTNKKNR